MEPCHRKNEPDSRSLIGPAASYISYYTTCHSCIVATIPLLATILILNYRFVTGVDGRTDGRQATYVGWGKHIKG
jgi:hypothetical protein